jgi:hypothetical protein
MCFCTHRLTLCLTVSVFFFSMQAVSQASKNRIHIRDGKVCRGTSTYTLRAVEAQIVGDPAASTEEKIIRLHKIAEVGGNVACFDVRGVSPDGKTISADAVQVFLNLFPMIEGRTMTAIVRAVPKDAPDDAGFRENVVKAVATAFKREPRIVFLIDSPDSKKLVKEFHTVHPSGIVIAPEGGDIQLVKSWSDGSGDSPKILFNAVPPMPFDDPSHCLFPDTDSSYEALDLGMTFPEEKQPWTPDNSILTEQERADGWIALFDGKSLDGWFIMGKNKDGFKAEDGAIVWKARGGGSLRTVRKYDNFHLKCEWKIMKKNANNGIHLRAPRGSRASRIGMEYQIMGDYGVPPSKNSTGSVYDVVPPRVAANKPEGEWNETEIILDKAHLVFKLNGEVVQDLDMDQNPELKTRIRNGFIAITDHGWETAFRNIKLKKL